MVQRVVDQDELVEKTLRSCQSAWTGCRWETEFAGRKANLRGLNSRQALMAAQATRGKESDYWRDVFRYLEIVEKDARMAAEIAAESVDIWRRGEVDAALSKLDEAIALELLYRDRSVYSRLRTALQSTLAKVTS